MYVLTTSGRKIYSNAPVPTMVVIVGTKGREACCPNNIDPLDSECREKQGRCCTSKEVPKTDNSLTKQ